MEAADHVAQHRSSFVIHREAEVLAYESISGMCLDQEQPKLTMLAIALPTGLGNRTSMLAVVSAVTSMSSPMDFSGRLRAGRSANMRHRTRPTC